MVLKCSSPTDVRCIVMVYNVAIAMTAHFPRSLSFNTVKGNENTLMGDNSDKNVFVPF